jgi:carbon monoxide dehydrogenase subunit G
MQRFEGNRDFSHPPSALFARLTDVPFLVDCIPDVETVRSVAVDCAEMVLRPGFSFVRGTLDMNLRMVEKNEPTSTRVQLLSRGIGSSSEVEATLLISPLETGSRVHWTAEIKSLGGLLKLVPGGLIRGAAERVINEAWNRIEKNLKADTGDLS